MLLKGTVRGKVIELDEAAALPEGSRVEVILTEGRREELTVEEKLELVRKTRGMLRATREQVQAVMEEDFYGIE